MPMTKTPPSAERSAPTKTPSARRAPETATPAPRERRNETTHPDGAAAVAAVSCPSCKARKGAKCIRHDGERTNHVHSARMSKAGK